MWCTRFENVAEVQRQWKHELQTQPPTLLTITRLCDKFDALGTICDMHGGRSVRPRSATSPASSAMVSGRFTSSPWKSAYIVLYCNLYSTCDVQLNLVLTYNIEFSLVKVCIHFFGGPVLSFCLRLGLPSGVFPSSFSTKTLHTPLRC